MNKKYKAFSLIELCLFILFLGSLIVVFDINIPQISQKQSLQKNHDYIDSKINSILNYANENRTLPNNNDFLNLDSKNTDFLNKELLYIYDDNLENTNEAICNTKTTNLKLYFCSDSIDCNSLKTVDNIAFAIISAGRNQNIQTKVLNNEIFVYKQDALVDFYSNDIINQTPYDDIVKYKTLDDVKKSINCKEPILKLINNEIIIPQTSKFYGASFYVQGGVPFANDNYQWSYSFTPADPFTNNCSDNLDLNNQASYLNITCSVKPKKNDYTFELTVLDNDSNSFTRTFYTSVGGNSINYYITTLMDIYYSTDQCYLLENSKSVSLGEGEDVTFYNDINCGGKSYNFTYSEVEKNDDNLDYEVFVTIQNNKVVLTDTP